MEYKIKNFMDLEIRQKGNESEFAKISLTIHYVPHKAGLNRTLTTIDWFYH
jgi:hypothetical protein